MKPESVKKEPAIALNKVDLLQGEIFDCLFLVHSSSVKCFKYVLNIQHAVISPFFIIFSGNTNAGSTILNISAASPLHLLAKPDLLTLLHTEGNQLLRPRRCDRDCDDDRRHQLEGLRRHIEPECD